MSWLGDPFTSDVLGGLAGAVVVPAEVDAMIERDGTCGQYRRARACPCVAPDTNAPRADCPTCKGVGWLYPESLRLPAKALAGSRETNFRMMQAGQLLTGDLVATFPTSLGLPSMMDLWLPNGEQHRVRERRRRAFREHRPEVQTNIQRDLGYGTPAALPSIAPREPLSERLRYPEVLAVESVSWFIDPDAAPENRQLVEGIPGVDFVLLEGSIKFQPARGPADGTTYVVQYLAPACYVISATLPVFRHLTGAQQPYRTAMNRLDRLGSPDLA